MKHYIGIDLGTTNSVICSYDGEQVHVWKSAEQNDVTPSAIYMDKRGRRYYGRRAYDMAPSNEKNAATLFKRYMGTSKKFTFESTGDVLTPEACSAEILRVLYGYLPEEIREDPETGTVITVPAAFNQMKKDATLEAARLAGIGRVALMQEPVAAVMSVMKQDAGEKTFLIYDLGGGTFDISIAQNVAGRVSLLIQGGKEMCGGRDWDRLIYNKIVEPWLTERFSLPVSPEDPTMKRVRRLSLLAIEQAKIELSAFEESAIRMDEVRMGAQDLNGEEVYLDIPLTRDALDGLIAGLIDDTIEVTRETMGKIGLSSMDVEQIVFVGGPTCYKPLRDRVTAALCIGQGVEVNPMTAVAEGAAIYAESIDWQSQRHNRKSARSEKAALADLKINYEGRTAAEKAKVAFLSGGCAYTVELTSRDTGWVSGRVPVKKRAIVEVPLARNGENTFVAAVYDAAGMPVKFEDNVIVITRTLATVNAIPASYPIAVKALEKVGGKSVPIYLVEENDQLPKRGSVTFRAGQSLVAGSSAALVFTLWEGSIRDPIEENRYIGTYRIPGTSFYNGMIPVGAEIICEYEMNESGTLQLGVSIPCVGVNLTEQNFYSRVEGQTDLMDAAGVIRELNTVLQRTAEMKLRVKDPEIDRLREILSNAKLAVEHDSDPETIQAAQNDLLECRRRVARVKQRHLKEIRLLDLENVSRQYNALKDSVARGSVQMHEIAAFNNLEEAARRSIERNSPDFDTQLEGMRGYVGSLLWRQDDFVKLQFMNLSRRPDRFTDRARFDQLRARGATCLEQNRIGDLRQVLSEMGSIMIPLARGEDMFNDVNIVRG